MYESMAKYMRKSGQLMYKSMTNLRTKDGQMNK